MLSIAEKIADGCLNDYRVLNWVVLLSFLLDIPMFFGYERILPYFLTLHVPEGIDCVLLTENLSVALLPIFLVDFVSWIYFICAWRIGFLNNDNERLAAVLTPTRMRWSSSSLGYIVGQIVSALFLLANLFGDVCSELATTFVVQGLTFGTVATAIVGMGGFVSFLGSLKYCFVYWKANKADATIESVLN